MPDSDDRTDEDSASISMPEIDFGDHVDMSTFLQILEMDESEEMKEFSKPLVENFIQQAQETFKSMDKALHEENLAELSSLGHFLKGSSATLGFNKVRDSCQVIQQYGHNLNLDGTLEPDKVVCIKKIKEALEAVKKDMKDLVEMLTPFFGLELTQGLD